MNKTIDHFKNAMLDAGITPPNTIIGDGHLHRFKIDGKLNGAYVLHLDGRAAGYFQDFKQGIKQRWKIAGKHRPLTEAERQAFKEQCAKQDVERNAEEAAKHQKAANKAAYIWQKSKPAPIDHSYLVKKRINPYGVRLGRDNTLVIPLYNANRELVNLQFIDPEGVKRFLTGGKKAGCFYWLGREATDKILICEGFATGASLREHTGKLVVIAFDAGNLKAVAETFRTISPISEIIIAADNDESGIGEKKAREAALAICGKYIMPPTPGDFNDHLAGSA